MPTPVIDGLERLLGRSRAKDLALDGVQDLDESTLRRRARAPARHAH
jgi:hypothetical protein